MSEIQQILNNKNQDDKKNIFIQVVEQTNAIGNEISQALKSIKEINTRAHMLSTAAKLRLIVGETKEEISLLYQIR